MQNDSLVSDYLKRAKGRLNAVETLYNEKLWADVVRESQEIVELALKALLRRFSIEVPRIHDVGQILLDNQAVFPKSLRGSLQTLADISHNLRRDRELAFYGSEDITPSEFYKEKHAKAALEQAREVVETCLRACK